MPLLADGLHNLRHALRSWAVLIHWLPTASSMSSLHLLLGLPLSRFPSLGVHSDVIFAHLVFFILATCPAHCPFMHFTFSIISITPVFDLIISFLILSLLVMFNNDLSMLRWATASFLSIFPYQTSIPNWTSILWSKLSHRQKGLSSEKRRTSNSVPHPWMRW